MSQDLSDELFAAVPAPPPPGQAPPKTRRPWYKKKRFLIAPGILAFSFIVGALSDLAPTPTPVGGASADEEPAAAVEAPEPAEQADTEVEIPDLTGVLAADAVAQLEALGLSPEVRAAPADATVTGTVPATGQVIIAGSTVTVVVESAEETAAAEAARVAEEERLAAEEERLAAEEERLAAEEERLAAEEERLAAEAVAGGTVSQQKALELAQHYLNSVAFSRTGLIGQLEYEQFSTEDATWAVDRVTVDWNEQAAKFANEYLEFSSFSRSSLIDQLLHEGFTREQAEYGVSQTGL